MTFTACVWTETHELVDFRRGPLLEVIRWARQFLTTHQPNRVGLFANVAPSDKEI